MAKKFANSLSNSLKGKIWLATTALALFVCVFGILSYLIVLFLINDSFYAIFVPSLLLSVSVVIFGWWLGNEITTPIEKVILLAKSLERGVTTSLPKTSGSTETDELMESLSRLNRQVHTLVNSMDDAAQGKTVILPPSTSNSDRISNTFQKLLTKISESIRAQQNLEKLQSAVNQLADEVSAVRQNNLYISISSNSPQTEPLSNTLVYLIDQLNSIISQVKMSSSQSHILFAEVQKTLQTVIQQDENRIQGMSEASITLKQVPNIVKKISLELSQSSDSANQSIEKAKNGTSFAHAHLNSINQLRKKVQESIKQIQKLNESSQEIGRIAKTVEDLAHRTNMIALNASIQAAELGEKGHNFVVVSEEVERLAERAGNTNKHISSLNKTIQAEINQAETSLESTVGEISELSKFAIETGNSIGELERYVTQFLHLQEKIISYTNERTEDTDKAFQTFTDAISETETSVIQLRDSEKLVGEIKSTMENMQTAISHFNPSPHSNNEHIETPLSDYQMTAKHITSI
jgi:methyl-accepting chemotaxis protein